MIFLDTSYLLAESLSEDKMHTTAKNMSRRIAGRLYGNAYISDYVFDEAVTFVLAKTNQVSLAIKFGKRLKETTNLLRIGEKTFDLAWKLFCEQKNTRLSFTDCTSLALMEEHGISTVATFDHGFKSVRLVQVVDK